jgi:type IV secretory pathway VirB2 component (pilin)
MTEKVLDSKSEWGQSFRNDLHVRGRFRGNGAPMNLSLKQPKWIRKLPTFASIFTLLVLMPVAALAQSGSPFDTGFTSLQTLFTGTIAKVASLIAIVIGGYGFAHGEPGAKKALAGVAAGTGIAVLAANVLSWLWGV